MIMIMLFLIIIKPLMYQEVEQVEQVGSESLDSKSTMGILLGTCVT